MYMDVQYFTWEIALLIAYVLAAWALISLDSLSSNLY